MKTAVEWLVEQLTEVDYGCINKTFLQNNNSLAGYKLRELFEQAKEMEKEQKQRFNKFLNDEMELGISDKKTIERIQWYYNNYLSTFKTK